MSLKIRTEIVCEDRQPFVVRICEASVCHKSHSIDHPWQTNEYDARVTRQDTDCLYVSTPRAELKLHGVKTSEILGDVLLVVPHQGISSRLIRAKSKHNTLLITEQCDQMCVMCSQPPKSYHADWFDYYKIAIKLSPTDSTIGLSGGEPTLYKAQLFELLEDVFEHRPDIKFHILTNAQHFDDYDIGFLQASRMRNVCWGVPLYASDSIVHDQIVGKSGAFDTLIPNLQRLIHSPANVELRTVLVRQNKELLKSLSKYIGTHLRLIDVWAIMQLEYIGYAKANWDEIFVDTSMSFDEVSFAIDHSVIRGVIPTLYNFPMCTVPEPYRQYVVNSISDWKQKYLSECDGCDKNNVCGGFFQWYDPSRGFREIHAL
jgi:His-Xaa-Ser system radical SAM maturase HxsC